MSPDPIDLLVRAADLGDRTHLVPDPVAAVRSRLRRRRARRRTIAGLAAAAVVVAVAAGVVVAADRGEDREGVVVSPPSTLDGERDGPTSTGPPGDAEEVPLAFRVEVGLAWTGEEVVVWGGRVDPTGLRAGRSFADGAAYDPLGGTWRTMAPSPLSTSDAPSVAASADGGALVARGTTVALWSAGSDTWTELPPAPGPVTDLTAVGDGRFVSLSAAAVLDVDAGRWSGLDGAPVDLEAADGVWTGTELVVVGRRTPPTVGFDPAAAAYRPSTGTWRTLAAPAESVAGLQPSLAWDGEQVVAVTASSGTATYDPATDTWVDMPGLPVRPDGEVVALSAGATAVATPSATVLRGADGRWTPIAPVLSTEAVAVESLAGEPLVAEWTSDATTRTNSVTLADLLSLGEPPLLLQVGPGTVLLDADDVTAGTTRSGSGDGVRINVTLDAAEGGQCTVASVDGLARDLDPATAVREELAVDDPGTQQGGRAVRVWFHDAAGTRWETELFDSELLQVRCEDAATARRLVEAVRAAP